MDVKQMWVDIVDTANNAIERDESDFVKNGLLYCGKCKTPKQAHIELFGEVFEPLCLCKCATEKRDRENTERLRRARLEYLQKMRKEAFPDASLEGCSFDRDDTSNVRVSNIARRYVENFDEMRRRGKGLLFYGTVGTGKTFMSACIANALIDKYYPCLVTNISRLTNTLSGMFDGKQAYIDGLNRYELLVIDDLFSERDTEYVGEIVMQIIDSRYRAGLPLIVTTNISADELKNPSDIRRQRIYSRLLEMCVPVEVKGIDRRKAKLKEDYKELEDLLGL